jgi:hypothetical protein
VCVDWFSLSYFILSLESAVVLYELRCNPPPALYYTVLQVVLLHHRSLYSLQPLPIQLLLSLIPCGTHSKTATLAILTAQSGMVTIL